MKKKWIAAICALTMAFSFTGCGNDKGMESEKVNVGIMDQSQKQDNSGTLPEVGEKDPVEGVTDTPSMGEVKTEEPEMIWVLSSHTYYGNGTDLSSRYEYEYDDRGNTIVAYYYDYNGELYSTSEYGYNENNDQISIRVIYRDEDYLTEMTYDENHHKLSDTYYDPNHEITSENHFTYDGDLRVKAVYSSQYNDYDTVYDYEYDENGNCIRELNQYADSVYETLREFDENGNLIKVTYKGPGFERFTIFEYDSKKRNTATYDYTGEDSDLLYYATIEYDDENHIVTNRNYNMDGEMSYQYVTQYDDAEHALLESYESAMYNYSYSVQYTYDDAYRVIRVDYPNEGAFIEYTYDAYGNEIEELFTSGDGENHERRESTYVQVPKGGTVMDMNDMAK